MKHPYLLRHVSSHLHTFVRCPDEDTGPREHQYGTIVDFSDEPFGSAVILSGRLKKMRADIPLILSVSGQFSYGYVNLKKKHYLVGPLRFEDEVFFSHVVTPDMIGLTGTAIDPDWLRSVPMCRFRDFVRDLLLLHNYPKTGLESDPFLDENRLIQYNCVPADSIQRANESMTELIFENREIGFVHNPYNHEAREVACIRNGDVEGLKKVLEEVFTGRYGFLSKNPVRQEINMGIVLITLATRAAIDGGVHPETAFYISDVTIQQMEAARDVHTVENIYRRAEYQLTEMVRDLNKEKKEDMPVVENRHISHCKDYIFTHLHDRLQIREIASAIGLETNYLSALFKKCEHITLKQYITKEKIKLVKNLLIYSSYSYSKIAVYLGFSSQSHLGAEFRKATGMTMKEFRDANAREDFVYDQMFQKT